jgi:cobalt-zinc-cadmium efflux system protein
MMHELQRGHEASMDSRLLLSAALNVVIAAAELVGGLLTGSLALLADAAHNVSDVTALVLAIVARRLGRRAPTVRHTYGLRRVEVLAALANATSLLVITFFISREALYRLLHPQPVEAGPMLVVALVALAANALAAWLLRRHEHRDINVRAAFLHLVQDALASLAVVVAALLATTRFGAHVDPVAALAVGLVVLHSAVSIVWETLGTLVEAVPRGLDVAALADKIGESFAPVRLHHVHVWEVGPGETVLTAHVTVPEGTSVAAAEALACDIRGHLAREWSITHATLEAEVEGCGSVALIPEHGPTAPEPAHRTGPR